MAEREKTQSRTSVFNPCLSAYSGVAATRLYAVSIRGQNLLEFGDGFGQLRLGDGQRRGEADDIAVLAFGQKDLTALQHGFYGLQGRVSGWPAVGQTQFHSSHQAQTAHGNLQFRVGNF